MEDIQRVLAKNLKEIRKREKLSLEKVAALSGVSKTMIGQIERGESSPTLTTIWKIATGLKISFTALVQHAQPETTVIRKADMQMLPEDANRLRVYPVFPFDAERRFEMYTVEIDPAGELNAEAHREGTEEFITVFDGELKLTVNETEYHLTCGDSIRFQADRPHTYANAGKTLTRLSMNIYYRPM